MTQTTITRAIPDLEIIEGQITTTSQQIAAHFNKVHRDVVRAIENIECSAEFRLRNFAQSSYVSNQNKVLDCFTMTRDGFAFLCMGFTGQEAAKWKEAYISAFNAIEQEMIKLKSAPSSMIALNELTAKIESDKDVASFCGKELNKYKTIKKQNEDAFMAEVKKAQLTLGFDKGVGY